MSLHLSRLTGVGLIILGIYLNIPFSILSVIFDYPEILREPTGHVLTLFKQGGPSLIAVWYAFALTPIILVIVVLLMDRVLLENREGKIGLAAVFGVLAGILQALGLIRWVFVVPGLADAYTDPKANEATKAAAAIVFEGFHQYAGVAIGEHLGQLFTALWLILVSAAIIESDRFCNWQGIAGIIIALFMILGLVEGFATVIPFDGAIIGVFTPLSFIALSVWMIVLGIVLLWQTDTRSLHLQRLRFAKGDI